MKNPLVNKSIELPQEYIRKEDFSRNMSDLNNSKEARAVSFSMEEFPTKICQTLSNSISLNNRLSKNEKKNYSMVITQFKDDNDVFIKEDLDREREKRIIAENI